VRSIIGEQMRAQSDAQWRRLGEAFKGVLGLPQSTAGLEGEVRTLRSAEAAARSRSLEAEASLRGLRRKLESTRALLATAVLLQLSAGFGAGNWLRGLNSAHAWLVRPAAAASRLLKACAAVLLGMEALRSLTHAM
jgi:hypothetical protein